MKKDFSKIISYIHQASNNYKLAETVTDPDDSAPAAGTTVADPEEPTPTPTPSIDIDLDEDTRKSPKQVSRQYTGYQIKSVLEMQQAMVKLSEALKNVDGYALSYFIANYSDRAGKATLNSRIGPLETTVSGKQTNIEEITRDILNSLTQTGYQKSLTSLDGIWGPRTQAAVKNSLALAERLLNFDDLIGYSKSTGQQEFTQQDLATLTSLVPENEKISNDEKNKKAKGITPLINKLTYYVKVLFDYIAKNLTPEKRQVTVSQEIKPSENLSLLIKQYPDEIITGYVTIKNYKFPDFKFKLSDLISPREFNKVILENYKKFFNKDADETARESLFGYESISGLIEQLKDKAYEHFGAKYYGSPNAENLE